MTTPATVQRVDALADVRAGDKGDTLIVAVLARDHAAYRHLTERLTEDVVAAHYGELVTGTARRTVQPNLLAMVVELPGVLGGGVTGSPALDGHGKTLGYHLLSLEI
ncbi:MULTISPECIES: hypothetical protein [unclassified Rhodococcus (in: high G+C Gram-positive bacteria)]|uniref:AtuA-related protein n=1 Tax=unclassified Rhodococcus (in: high G+C Gram-positive bacteria) TaxID=192944 RepID=UPI001639C897|nr:MULTISPECIES: hypothetical protein [unclassified Rhodococcus (in: high G+C Gram-positive bacteria)]MBC2642587.1 hypothetical protein [Rhodococcus sp. 3A]MBC2892671.1 hypothetical protein [Rhodococcus sp. 4CII]